MKRPVYDPNWTDEVKAVWRHDLEEMWDRSISTHIWNCYHDEISRYLAYAGEGRALDILDVGCAQGTLALSLAEAGHRVLALDIRPGFLEYAAARYTHGEIRFLCANAMEVSLVDRFELVFANQILEHLVFPAAFVARLAGWLKPGGRLVMTTPNWRYLRNNLPRFSDLKDVSSMTDRQYSADGDGHFFAYSARELLDIVAAAGLEEVRVRYLESPWITGHMKFRYLHRFVPAPVLKALDRTLMAIPRAGTYLGYQLLVEGRLPHSGLASGNAGDGGLATGAAR